MYSWNTNGWEPNKDRSNYMDRNQRFRRGRGIKIPFSTQQEREFEQCLMRHSGEYSLLSNNCATPPQKCLNEMGIYFPVAGNSNLGLLDGPDGTRHQHVLPNDFGNSLVRTYPDWKTENYPQTQPTSTWDAWTRAPWANWHMDGAPR
jgi:hypothetical protein